MLTLSSIMDITNNEARDFKGIGFISGKRMGVDSRYRNALADNRSRVTITNSSGFIEDNNEERPKRIPKANVTFFGYHPDD